MKNSPNKNSIAKSVKHFNLGMIKKAIYVLVFTSILACGDSDDSPGIVEPTLSCPELDQGTLNINSLGDISPFAGPYKNCKTIEGNLILKLGEGGNTNDLSNIEHIEGDFKIIGIGYNLDLSGFKNLKTVGGDFHIYATGPESYEGFESLESIEGNLLIERNEGTGHFKGFDNLQSIGGDIIYKNNKFTELAGFSSLIEVGNILIENEYSLKHIYGFDSLAKMKGIHIENIHSIESIAGFNVLTHVESDIIIEFNRSLLQIHGFDGDLEIGGNLIIFNNPALDLICGFENVKSTGGFTRIDLNAEIIQIGGCK